MARRMNMAFLAAIAIAALIQSSAAQTNLVVGDSRGWTIPSSGSYSSWAANQTFRVGDVLVFNFANNVHDVAQVRKADYDACNTSNPISLMTTSPARITLNATGEYYFICTFAGHCAAGQKLMVNVSTATSATPAPQPSPSSTSPAPQPSPSSTSPAPQPTTPTPSPVPPVSAPSPAPSGSAAATYTVLDSAGWAIPPNGAAAYRTWAANKNFAVGDTLVFNYPNGAHNVAEVTKEAYDSCNTTSPISLDSSPPTRITLTTPGEHFFICAFPQHCSLGQKLAINVTGSATAIPPSSTTPSSPSPTGFSAPPLPGNSASSLGAAGLSATFLSIFVALLY